jgi:hypothetical protein
MFSNAKHWFFFAAIDFGEATCFVLQESDTEKPYYFDMFHSKSFSA